MTSMTRNGTLYGTPNPDSFDLKNNFFYGVLIVALSAVVFCVNSVSAIYTFWFKHRRWLRPDEYNDMMMGILAVSGVCISIFGLPWSAAANFLGYWPGREEGCKAATFFVLFFGTLTVSTTLLMSFERFLALWFPFKYAELVTHVRIRKALIFLLAHGAVLASLPLLLNSVELVKEPFAICLYSLSSHSVQEQVVVHAFVINFSLSLIVMLITNISVSVMLRRMSKQIQPGSQWCTNQERRQNSESVLLTKITETLALSYSMCWLPYTVRVLLMYHAKWKNRYFDFFALGMSAFDPFVYPLTCIVMSKRYRKGFLETAKRLFCSLRSFNPGIKDISSLSKASTVLNQHGDRRQRAESSIASKTGTIQNHTHGQ